MIGSGRHEHSFPMMLKLFHWYQTPSLTTGYLDLILDVNQLKCNWLKWLYAVGKLHNHNNYECNWHQMEFWGMCGHSLYA